MKYRVFVKKTEYGEMEVEAENDYEAEQVAEDNFGDDYEFEWDEYSEDWEAVKSVKVEA